MGRTPDKLFRPQWERDLLEEARRLDALGLDALATLRRARQEHEKPNPSESDDRAEAILSALEWLSTPEAKRTTRAPELTSLSDVEAEALRAALVAVEAGIPVAAIVFAELEVEEVFQSPRDRKAGRIARWETLPPILEILDREPYALFSYRIRRAFMEWLPFASTKQRNAALARLDTSKSFEDRKEDALAARVFCAVELFRELGLTLDAAMEAVASGYDPYTDRSSSYYGLLPVPVLDEDPPVRTLPVIPREARLNRRTDRRRRGIPDSGFPRHEALPVSLMQDDPLPHLSKGQVQVLLGRAERNLGVARKTEAHTRRPRRPRKP